MVGCLQGRNIMVKGVAEQRYSVCGGWEEQGEALRGARPDPRHRPQEGTPMTPLHIPTSVLLIPGAAPQQVS